MALVVERGNSYDDFAQHTFDLSESNRSYSFALVSWNEQLVCLSMTGVCNMLKLICWILGPQRLKNFLMSKASTFVLDFPELLYGSPPRCHSYLSWAKTLGIPSKKMTRDMTLYSFVIVLCPWVQGTFRYSSSRGWSCFRTMFVSLWTRSSLASQSSPRPNHKRISNHICSSAGTWHWPARKTSTSIEPPRKTSAAWPVRVFLRAVWQLSFAEREWAFDRQDGQPKGTSWGHLSTCLEKRFRQSTFYFGFIVGTPGTCSGSDNLKRFGGVPGWGSFCQEPPLAPTHVTQNMTCTLILALLACRFYVNNQQK